MILAKKLQGTVGNLLKPVITNTYNSRRNISFTATLPLGTPSLDRLIIVSLSFQGNGRNWAPTLDGQSPDYDAPPSSASAHFSVWRFPNGTSGTLATNANAGDFGGVSVYSVSGWDGFAVFDNQTFSGGDGTDFNHTVPVPLPENTILLGVWSTNEDGGASGKRWNFGVSTRYFSDGGAEDAGSAFEILSAADPSLDVECDSSGKRRSYGFLALGSGNLA